MEAGFTQSSAAEEKLLPPQRARGAKWFWLAIAAAVVAIVFTRNLFKSNLREESGDTHPAVGTRLTTFHLEPLTGDAQPASLENLDGKVTLINFWGPWCGPCMLEFPRLMEIEQHFRATSDFQFFSVATNPDPFDDRGLAESTAEFLRRQKAEFPTYRDPKAETSRALIESAKLEGFGYPATVVLDRQSIIRGLWIGYSPGDEKQVSQAIEKLLKSDQ